MRGRLRKGYVAVAVMAIAIALVIISMTAPVISTTADFSIFNSGWNGSSGLAVMTYKAGKFVPTFVVRSTGTDVEIAQVSLDRMQLDPLASALIIIGPTKAFTASEASIVGEFVRNGGLLFLADDFGTGNSLLAGMGATSRFSGDLVMDLAYEKQPEFSVLFDLRSDRLTRKVSTLLLNYPSSVVVNPATTESIAFSSIASWLDENGDRLQEWGEPRGPFTMLARERMGAGYTVLLSDPSVLINGMSKYMDNAIFKTNLVKEICSDRSVVMFDESHRTFFDPISITMQFTGQVSANAKAAIVLAAFVLTLWIATDLVETTFRWIVKNARSRLEAMANSLGLRFRRKRETPKLAAMSIEEMTNHVALKHPDWRAGLVRYLLRERQRHGRKIEQEGSREH